MNIRTGLQMYNYCIRKGYGSGMTRNWGIKHFNLAAAALGANEEVKMCFIGLHNSKSTSQNDGYFAYVITNKRFIMSQKKLVGEKFQTVSLDDINDITFNSGLALGTITIDTIREKFSVCMGKQSAKKVNEEIHVVLDSLKRISTDTNEKVSAADEIKKYKELLDLGAITQEEYDFKKKQLLGM